jgi:hypothetical protein
LCPPSGAPDWWSEEFIYRKCNITLKAAKIPTGVSLAVSTRLFEEMQQNVQRVAFAKGRIKNI